MLRQTTWWDQSDIGELKIANRKQSFNKRYAGIRCTNNYNSRVLENLRLTKQAFGRETKSKWCFIFIKRVSILSIDWNGWLLLIISILRPGVVSLMIPLSVEEVRESTRTNVNQLVEYCWNHSLGLDLEVERSLVWKSQKFFEKETRALFKDWVDNRVN